MAEDAAWRRDAATKGAFVIVGVAYVLWGPPFVGLEPGFVGGALAAYGVVSFAGRRLIARWGVLRR